MQGQHRYAYLDGLRGVAAIYVVFYHIGMRFGGPQLVPNGYLAVDFFFMLSGFVIAGAYERKLQADLSLRRFVARRLIRLLPMSVLGVAIGTSYLLARYAIQPDMSDTLPHLLGASALNLVLLPKVWVGQATLAELFPANGPLWSLFFEMAINIVWAAALVALSLRRLVSLALAGAGLFGLCAVAFGTADVGWNLENLYGGLGRVTYGFTVGVILFRLKDRVAVSHPAAPWLALVLLGCVVLVPIQSIAWTVPVAILVLPLALLLALGAGARAILPGEDLLGRLSYPLYAVHVPLLMMVSGVQKKLFPDADLTIASLLLPIPIILFALLALRFYDEPLRRALDARLSSRRDRSGRRADLATPDPIGPGIAAPSNGEASQPGAPRPAVLTAT